MRIWMLTVLELWCRAHLDGGVSGAPPAALSCSR
jgi:hypothetical protein